MTWVNSIIIKIFFLLGLLFTFNSFAVAEKIDFGPEGQPDEHDYKFNAETGLPWEVMVNQDNPDFLSAPNGRLLSNPPQFKEILRVYRYTNNQDFFLVRKLGGNEWGWIPAEHIIISQGCLKEKDIDTESQNPANIKVAIKNNWRKDNTLDNEDISIRSGPDETFPEIGKVNIFEIRYAYDFQNGYIFLGAEENWENSEEVMEGWVKQAFCTIWPSRIGVYYDKSNLKKRNPIKIYRKQEDLLANQSPIAIEDKKITGEQQYYAMRFPVIRKINDTLNISFIGNANLSNGDTISKNEIDRTRDIINDTINNQQTKEIFFLIDATKSMQPYLEATYKVIDEYINMDRGNYKYGFGIYRDYIDEQGKYRILCTFNDKNCLDALKNVWAYSPSGDNYTEAVFNGIHQSINKANWGDGLKAIILIGDHGNHEQDNLNYTEQQIADQLMAKDIWFYSINVNYRSQLKYYNELFQRQMSSILKSNQARGNNFAVTSNGQDDIDAYKKSLLTTLEEIKLFSKKSVNAIKEARNGASLKEIREKYGTVLTDYMISMMKKKNINLKNMNFSDMVQVCEEGWAFEFHNGMRQFKPWVLMTRTELQNFMGFLNGLLFEKDVSRVADTVRQSAQRALGDEIKGNERISEFLSRAILYIPYEDISPTLQLTPEELQEKFIQDRTFRKEFCKEIGKKRMQLDLVLKEENVPIEWDEDYNNYRLIGESKKKKWFWTSKSGIYYAWIPFEYLP
ncbi:MAG: vWA domain-containing protein [Desulfobacteraceae bacterium]|jgi:predicted transcriptional regulator